MDTEAAGNVTPVSAPEQRWAVEVRASDLTHRTTGQESTTDRHLAHRVSVTQCGALVLWDDDRPGNPVQGYAPGTWLQFYLDPED